MKNIILDVAGRNALNKACIEILTAVLPQLDKFVGKKVSTNNGLSKKFIIDIPNVLAEPLEGGHSSCNAWLDCNYNKLRLNVKVCLNGGSYDVKPSTAYCKYFNEVIDIADVDTDILSGVKNIEDLIRDYGFNILLDANVENNKIEQLKALMERVGELRRSIYVSSELYRHLIR